jgi:hypothetical protein
MAVAYETLLPDILPVVAGCTDTLVEDTIRAAVIEFCERTGAYQAELDPITTVSSIYEYDLEPPTGTKVHKIMGAVFEGDDLEPVSSNVLEQRKPNWRNAAQFGQPEYYIQQSASLFWLVPVPNTLSVNSTIIRAQLKPTYSSTTCDEKIMDEYRDTIVNGALFRLLRMPGKDWSDLQGAQLYSNLFEAVVITAERRARHADEGVARRVVYKGVGRFGSGRRNRYGRERG